MSDPVIQPISTPEGLQPLITAIQSADEIYLDTEADSLHHYFEKICLLQFTVPEKDGNLAHFLVDPLAGLDLAPLVQSLVGKNLVLHGSDYDLRLLQGSFGFSPHVLFDTMLAARLAGHSGLGLDALVQRYIGQSLDHGAQKADWSQRPLPPRLLQYAVDDTRHLPVIATQLRTELTSLGRLEWHRQQCAQLVESTKNLPAKNIDEAWRIKGSHGLDRFSLCILRELWKWRDLEARDWDRPPFMVCGNIQLLDWTAWAREHPHGAWQTELRLPKRWPPRRLKSLSAALTKAWNTPDGDWPLPPPRGKRPPFNPEFKPAMERLRTARNLIAQKLNLDPSILASNSTLEAIVESKPGNPQAFSSIEKWLPWQTEVLGSTFLEALAPPITSV